MEQLHLWHKKVDIAASPILFSYRPDKDWEKYFMVMGGDWHEEDGWLIGEERGNKGGILFTRECFQEDVMLSFTIASVLPATRDLNAVFCAHWDEKTNYLGESYVCGLNGWYDHKSGIERNDNELMKALTNSYVYTPGAEVEMCVGSIHGHTFMVVDDELVCEYIDPTPLLGGHFGFSPYCTKLFVRDVEIMKIAYIEKAQSYDPEF